MIEIRFMEPEWCPMVICDACGCPIDRRNRLGDGNALWPADTSMPEGKIGDPMAGHRRVYHAHKGRCDLKIQERVGEHLLWEGLSEHLAFLFHNAGFGQEDLERSEEYWRTFS
jgi:hypothetical protein